MERWCYRCSVGCGRLLTLSVCLSGNSQAQIKKGHWYNRRPSGFSYNLNSVFLVKEFPTLPKKGLSEARLPVNVYVIEYAAKLITTNLTAKFFNENFVKKIPTFWQSGLNKSTFKYIWNLRLSLKTAPRCRLQGGKIKLQSKLMFNSKRGLWKTIKTNSQI